MSAERVQITDHVAFRLALVFVVGALMAYPALTTPPMDEFPLSSYPMFASHQKTDTTETQIVAIDDAKAEKILGPSHLGTDEVLQARAILTKAVRGGRKARAELCGNVAQAIAKDPDTKRFVEVELRSVTHDSVTVLTNPSAKPKAKNVYARCSVPR